MKNEKGMTLVEVVVAMSLVGIIALVFFKTATFGYTNIINSKKYTVDSFKVQEDIEKEINDRRNKDVDLTQSNTSEKTIFGKKIKGHISKFEIKSNTTSAHGEYIAFIPKIVVAYDIPEISDVSLTVGGKKIDRVSMVNRKNEIDTSLLFKGGKVNVINNHKDFLMNVYRWYISPDANPYPNDLDKFLSSSVNDFIILKEWNSARRQQDYVLNDFSMIPNIERDYDEFSFGEIKVDGKDKDQRLIDMFSGRFILYSVTPYSTVGKMGEEKFSNPIYIEPVK